MGDILVTIDGSAFSEYALPVALDIARRSRARVHVVQVHEAAMAVVQGGDVPVFDQTLDQMLRRQEEKYLLTLANRCEQRGVRPRTELLDGPVSAAISRYAAEVGIDMIVMTTHGRGGISRAWVGSVADALVRRGPVPVLLVRPKQDQANWDRELQTRHILVPLDGSPLSESVLSHAVALGSLNRARYTLLRIVLPLPFLAMPGAPPVFNEEGARQSVADADVYLERVAGRLRAEGVRVDVKAVMHSVPAQGILDYAACNAVDAIVMATHGRGGWSRVALGSVADKVMRGTMMPVMLYRPTLAERDEHADTTEEVETHA